MQEVNLNNEGIINDNFFGEKEVISQTKHQIFKMANFIKHTLTLSKLVNQLTNTDPIVKDLVHAGHIFFGEVAVESVIVQDDRDGRFSVIE